MKGLQDKVAIVTGGSSGIGQAIAIRLGQEGVHVAINYVGPTQGAEETKEAIEHGVDICMKRMSESGTRPILVHADVSDEDDVTQMFDRVLEEYGRLDYLINNAGIQIAADTQDLPVDHFDIREYTDTHHENAVVPHTLIVSPGLVIERVYVGYWFWGRPSPEQLWMDLGDLHRRIKSDFDPTVPAERERFTVAR